MSLENLRNKQTIILHNCEVNNEKFDLVITPLIQSIEYIRTKRQTIKRKILSKQKQIARKRLREKYGLLWITSPRIIFKLSKFKIVSNELLVF